MESKRRRNKPHSGTFEEFVEEQQVVHRRFGPDSGSHVAVFSKENEGPNKPKGAKTLLSGLPVEVSVSANGLSRRK